MICTTAAPLGQMMGWLEVVRYWVNRPQKKWLNWTLGGIFVVLMILPAPGLLTRK